MSHQAKYSEIFLKYVEILRFETQNIKDPKKLSSLLMLPEQVWNAVILDEAKGTTYTQELLSYMDRLQEPQRTSGRKMLEYWITRKKEKFAGHNWSVEHSVRDNGDQLVVRVQARDFSEASPKSQ